MTPMPEAERQFEAQKIIRQWTSGLDDDTWSLTEFALKDLESRIQVALTAAVTQGAAQEREACACIVDDQSKCKREGFTTCQYLCEGYCDVAKAIRYRKEGA